MDASTEISGSGVDQRTLERYADLVVELGANVQPGQIVSVRSELRKEELTRAVVASAYRRGAKFVDVDYFDPYVRRARILHAADETLEFYPSWHRDRVLQLGEQRCARIALSGVGIRGVFDGLDQRKLARERFPFIPEFMQVINDRTTNWTGVACPTPDWAAMVHPDLDPDEALTKLWEQVLHVCRADEDDPVAAWQARLEELKRARTALNEHRFDALHYEGPGTDLTIGLLPTSTWDSGIAETVDGIEHLPNIPTEEAFTAPDPQRADGVVAATKPLQLGAGLLVTGLRVRFEGGRAVEIDADTNAEALRAHCDADEGAGRLGEVALVDAASRVGALDTVFYSTLLDENAASHFAFGSAYLDTVGEEDRDRANRSSIHIDFMIGGEEVDVTGITPDGERVPVLRGGTWQI